MPRTTTLESPGCPPLRALTFDSLGLIKVIESRSNQGIPQVVERWGELDSSKCVLTASIDDSQDHPLLAVARKSGTIEVINPLNGNIHVEISNFGEDSSVQHEDDVIVGLHLFRKERLSGSCTLLTCTSKGNASIRSLAVNNKAVGDVSTGVSNGWKVCASGNIHFSKVHGMENFALFGGKGVEVNLWDLEQSSKIWIAKPPPKNSLGIFTPTWFTAATFLTNEDHRKFVAGTNNHQVRLYDISAQRRPVMSVDFRETPIKAVAEDQDGYTIYIGNGSGDLAKIDVRTGKLLGCFIGKCAGSIRSVARHPELPVLASCGLDSYLRLWDINTRQLLSATFLKQHLTNVVFDSNFSVEEVATETKNLDEVQTDNKEETQVPVKKKKSPKSKESSRKKMSEVAAEAQNVSENKKDDNEETPSPMKRKKSSKSKERSRKMPSEVATEDQIDSENKPDDVEEIPAKRKKSSKSKEGSKRPKSKKKTRRVEGEMNGDDS